MTKHCDYCGRGFRPKRGSGRPRRYCDPACKDAADQDRALARRRAAGSSAQRQPRRAKKRTPIAGAPGPASPYRRHKK